MHASIRFALLVSIFAVSRTWGAGAEFVQLLRVPDGGIQPQVQTDARGGIHLIYFKGDPRHGDVFYVRSDDGGASFTPPLRVNSQAQSAIAIGTVRGPHIALGMNGRVHVAWMGSDLAEPKLSGGRVPMLYARLNDAGKAFEPQRNLIARYYGLDGGGAVAADGEGNVYVAWHAPRDQANEADRRVWISRSRDDGKTFEPEHTATEADTGACGCCGMNIATDSRGNVYILFRSATEMVNRDMYLLESQDHGNTFRVAWTDPWKIGMCVMSTSGFAATGEGMLAAWEARNQIRASRIGADGSPSPAFSAPAASGNCKHPAIAANARGEFIIAWAEGTGWNKGGAIAWQVFDRNGHAEPEKAGRADGLPTWDAPAAFAAADGTFRILY